MNKLALQNSKNILKKHVNAIHCSNSLTLLERKISNVLLFNAYNDLPHKDFFTIGVKKLYEMVGYNSRNSKVFLESLNRLSEVRLKWGSIASVKDEKKINWGSCSILASIEVNKGVCRYEYSNKIKEFLYHPDIYGSIDINKQIAGSKSDGC